MSPLGEGLMQLVGYGAQDYYLTGGVGHFKENKTRKYEIKIEIKITIKEIPEEKDNKRKRDDDEDINRFKKRKSEFY
jgi:hypothetical protein